MRSRFFMLFMVVSLLGSVCSFAASQPENQGIDPELQKFQGTWVLVSAEMDGKKVKDTHVKQSKITFNGNNVEVITPHQHKHKIIATVTKMDPTKNPKEIHWVRSSGPNAGTPTIGIYEFEGPDQYRISFDPAGYSTPRDFGTKEGSGHVWHTWKKVKK